MTERDFEEEPYTAAECRIVDYLIEISDIGGGEDPVGFLIASHRAINVERERLTRERDEARSAALDEAALIIERHQIVHSANGDFLEPRRDGDRNGRAYAVAIRAAKARST